jgi:hypothetical protein
MKHKTGPLELVIDLVLPARFASRYRARLTALSRLGAQIRLAFCPSIFRAGVSSCPADVWVASGPVMICLRTVVEVQISSHGTIGQIHFDRPLERAEFEALRDLCGVDAVFDEPAAVASAQDESTMAATAPLAAEQAATLH